MMLIYNVCVETIVNMSHLFLGMDRIIRLWNPYVSG